MKDEAMDQQNKEKPRPVEEIAAPESAGLAEVARLVAIMARLRGEGGCEWDRAQDFRSIAPYTVEEAHEVADAIERGDMQDLQEELGDLLLQVVFHARMAEEAGLFALADVARGIGDKMERRHPHIFGGNIPLCAEEVKANWETIKAAEKPRDSVLDGVAMGLPALLRAHKISERARRTGFDWPDAEGARCKVMEEIAELDEAATNAEREEEAGDLLFAVVNWLRHLGVNGETALRLATAKFERRFRAIEKDPRFATADLDGKEALWQAVKKAG